MPAEDHVDPTRPDATRLDATRLDATRTDATRTDAVRLDDVAARLARSSTAALEASHELLAHYPDTGDASTQRAVDTLIDQAAAALGALTDALAQTSRRLAAAARVTTPQSGESALGRAVPRRDPFV